MSQGHGCGGGDGHSCGCGGGGNKSPEELRLLERMNNIKNKVLVMSGKGGVGKSTVAANLAVSLVARGKKVGLLDVDVHGPTIPILLGVDKERAQATETALIPVEKNGLKVVSVAFLLQDADSAIIWRGPLKMSVITQFLRDVEWGELDYLIVDAPPGTGDEPMSIAQLVPEASALLVTTPQKVSTADVRKSIQFCRTVNMPILGLAENMAGMVCPHCNNEVHVFPQGKAVLMSEELGVPLLASMPLDPSISAAADEGISFTSNADSPAAKAMSQLTDRVLAACDKLAAERRQMAKDEITVEGGEEAPAKDPAATLRIALPIADGVLTNHPGHAEVVSMVDVDMDAGKILGRHDLKAPAHSPGALPKWATDNGAELVLAGGMGDGAKSYFEKFGAKVITGCPADTPEVIVQAYIEGSLVTGQNGCGCNH